MKITSARVIVTCPGRNFVTLKIETDDGLSGVGDATLNGRELSVASYLTDHVIPMLIGRDQYDVTAWNLSSDGRCAKCGTRCHGVFEVAAGRWGRRRQPVRLRAFEPLAS